ncbi:MAG: GTPase ObgE, partial [Kamptonema sp. SIO4C4]|nr:GTPase ObgE [Kamptonema sp. SIO4C4]
TLVPNLGVVRKPTGDGTVFADIPGLIAGAHAGIGLGHEFLRHIERTRLLVHLIDLTANNPIEDFHTIQDELKAYGKGLCDRAQILVLNKTDAAEADLKTIVKEELGQHTPLPILEISAATGEGLDTLLNLVWQSLENLAHEPLISQNRLG